MLIQEGKRRFLLYNLKIWYYREIKIADFGTSKRLAGLQLCTEDSVGTLQYMSPDVVLVPPMGYGPEVSH